MARDFKHVAEDEDRHRKIFEILDNALTDNDRVAEKVGFRHEGLALAYLNVNGEWQDQLMFAKLAEKHESCFLNPRSA